MADNPNGSSASFKLSTLETLGADPVMQPIDHLLLGAYMKFMNWPQRIAFLTNLKARIMTGMTAQATVSASRARLIKFGYLTKFMTKSNGAIIYTINNPRAVIVADHVVIAEETLREKDALRKEADRIRVTKTVIPRGNKNQKDRLTGSVIGVTEIVTPMMAAGNKDQRDRVTKSGSNSLEHPFQEVALKSEPVQKQDLPAPSAAAPTNPYASAKGR